MQYLIPQILICLIIAALLGLLLGWFIWGSLVRRLRAAAIDRDGQVAKLNDVTAKYRELNTRHSVFVTEKQTEMSEFARRSLDAQTVLAAKEDACIELESTVARLQNELQEKEAAWKVNSIPHPQTEPDLQAALTARETELEKQVQSHAAKDIQIRSLSSKISELEPLAASLPELKTAHQSAIARIAELEPLAAQLPALQTALSSKQAEIDHHLLSHADKAAHIESLSAKLHHLEPLVARLPDLEPLAVRVPQLEANLQSRNSHIAHLTEKLSALEPIVAQVPRLRSEIDNKQSVINAHIESQASKDEQIRVLHQKSTVLETQVVTIPQMQAQLDSLRQQLDKAHREQQNLTAELEQARASVPLSIVEPKAMAAVAGHYDGGNHVTTRPPASEQTPGQNETEIGHMHQIFDSLFQPVDAADIQQRAFDLAKARGFQNGSPQEDWLTAERQIRNERLRWAREALNTRTTFKMVNDGTPAE